MNLKETMMNFNTASRRKITKMKETNNQAFLYKINLYKINNENKDDICVEYTGQTLYNFCADAVMPIIDQVLIDLIYDRHNTPYESTTEDWEQLKVIFARIELNGGLLLNWI